MEATRPFARRLGEAEEESPTAEPRMNWIRSTMHLPDDCSDVDWDNEQEPAVGSETERRAQRPPKPSQAARAYKTKGMSPKQRKARWGRTK